MCIRFPVTRQRHVVQQYAHVTIRPVSISGVTSTLSTLYRFPFLNQNTRISPIHVSCHSPFFLEVSNRFRGDHSAPLTNLEWCCGLPPPCTTSTYSVQDGRRTRRKFRSGESENQQKLQDDHSRRRASVAIALSERRSFGPWTMIRKMLRHLLILRK